MSDEIVTLEPGDFGQAEERFKPVGIICPSTGLMVYITKLPESDRAELARVVEQERGVGGTRVRDIVLSKVIVNHDGGRSFTVKFKEAIKAVKSAEIERVYKSACNLNGLEYIETKPAKK